MIQNITSKNYVCCNFCNSKFYYDKDDLIDVDEKHYGFICPECGNEIIVKERKICSFPDSFFKFDSKDTKHLTDEKIQDMIMIILMPGLVILWFLVLKKKKNILIFM